MGAAPSQGGGGISSTPTALSKSKRRQRERTRVSLAFRGLLVLPRDLGVDARSKLAHVRHLDVSHNRLRDLSALEAMPGLDTLVADENEIGDRFAARTAVRAIWSCMPPPLVACSPFPCLGRFRFRHRLVDSAGLRAPPLFRDLPNQSVFFFFFFFFFFGWEWSGRFVYDRWRVNLPTVADLTAV